MTVSRRTVALASVGLLATVLSGCSAPSSESDNSASPSESGYPVTVSSCGVDYTYDAAPERVLLGAPGIVRTLDALGVADSAIGYALSDYTVDGVEEFSGLTQTTADYAPSREFLISAQPDLFLVNDEGQILGEGSASKDDLASIPANLYVLGGYCTETPAGDTIDVVYDDIRNLGAIYGVPEAADDVVAELEERVEHARSLAPDGETLTAGAVTIYDGTVYALGGSYYAAVLGALGLENGFADLGASWSEITPEAVLDADLDVILVTYSGTDPTAAISDAEALFANSPAVQNGKVIGLDETAFQSVGVAIIDVIEDAAHDLYGD